MEPIRVMIVDDHDMVRRGLRAYLGGQRDMVLVGEAEDGHAAVALALECTPDVVLMDLVMGEMGGAEATAEITDRLPDCRVIILTSYYDDDQVFPALQAGAFSYLLKTSRGTEIAAAIRAAVRGEPAIESRVATVMASRLRGPRERPHERLTGREREVLELLGHGLSNAEMAEHMGIGVKTVKTHVSNVLAKLDLVDRTQAAVYAHREGLVDP